MPGFGNRRRRISSERDPLGAEALGRSVRDEEDIPAMKAGDAVIFVGCAHEQPCPELVRPCSVAVWGPMKIWRVLSDGALMCERWGPDGPLGPAERFEPREVDTPEAAARMAVALQTEGAA